MRARLLTLLFSLLALAPLLVVLWAGGPWAGGRELSGAELLAAERGVAVRSEDGVRLELARPPRRIACTTAGVVDLVTQLIEPERVALLPQAAFSFSRLAHDPGPWAALPRFEGYTAESILAHEADLVIASGWQRPGTTAALRAAGVPVLVLAVPESWQEVLDDAWLLAVALGAEERGRALEAALERRVEALGPRRRALRAVSYTNLGTGGWIAGQGTTTDIVFDLLGIENAAAAAGLRGHQEIDLEGLIALAPELILVGAANEEEGIVSTLSYLRAQPALASLPALRDDLVVSLPQELFTTASTELLTAAERLADELDRRLGGRGPAAELDPR